MRRASAARPRRTFALLVICAGLAGCGTTGQTPGSSTGSSTTSTAVASAVTVSGNTLQLRTTSLQVVFNQAAITSLTNRLTGESYIASAGTNWVDLPLLQSDGQGLTPGQWVLSGDGLSAALQFKDTQRSLTLTAAVVDDEISVKVEGSSTVAGVVSANWGIQGLNLSPGRLLVPGEAGTYVDAKSAPSVLGIDYSVEWEHQMLVYQGQQGSLLLYARDPTPTYKRVVAQKPNGTLDISLQMFAPGPWPSAQQVAPVEWRLRGFADSWMGAAAAYKTYMLSVRPFVPATGSRAWVKNIRGVVIFETLDPSLLAQLASKVTPSRTMLLLLTWRQQPFDQNYPDYTPDPAAVTFVNQAKALGFRVMLHTNLLGVSEVNPAYAALQSCQIKTADSLQPTGWLWDELPAGDPRRFAYVSPACSAVRKTFIAQIKPAIDALQPDALHLDAGGAIVNDGNGLLEGMNSMQGMIQMHKDILAAYPNLVLGGESTNEIIAPYNWVAQRWNAPSPPSPLSAYLTADQVFYYGFLDQPEPDDDQFLVYMSRYEGQGVIPVVFITTPSDLDASHPQALAMLNYQRTAQDHQYTADWAGDWSGLLFREKSADGATVLTVKNDGTITALAQNGSILFQHVQGQSSYATSYFIPNWPAYDDQHLFGTVSARPYWITNSGYRPAGEMHITGLPANLEIGTDTLRTRDYGIFEVNGSSNNWFDFVGEFGGAVKGTTYNLNDYGVINGAVIKIGTAYVKGTLYDSVIFEHPPYEQALGGSDYIEYSVPVPSAPKVTLTFNTALSDGSSQSDGVLFGLSVNGQTLWKQTVLPDTGWNAGSADLTPYAGTTVRLRLMAHPGLKLNPYFDSACWNAVAIKTDFTGPASIPVQFATSPTSVATTSNASVSSLSGSSATVAVTIPSKFAVFPTPPKVLQAGDTLLGSASFTAWQASSGLPVPGAYDISGTIGPSVSNGVTRTAIAAIPPREGQTVLSTAVTFPVNATTLRIGYALADAPAGFGPIQNYSGAQFIARVNGTEVMNQMVSTAGWNMAPVDITAWQGRPVVVELIVDADGDQLFDFGRFADLTVQ